MQPVTQPGKLADLEEAVRAQPLNADLRHLLAAEYAQHGQYERAVGEFREVLALNPDAHVARFQLGLLELTRGEVSRAIEVLAPLEALPAGAALKSFKRGLEALIRDEFDLCARLLGEGIQANTQNVALNEDMRTLLARLPTRPGSQQPDSEVRTDFSLYGPVRH
jgi:tetratricopeptide (TPR) repeat protein